MKEYSAMTSVLSKKEILKKINQLGMRLYTDMPFLRKMTVTGLHGFCMIFSFIVANTICAFNPELLFRQAYAFVALPIFFIELFLIKGEQVKIGLKSVKGLYELYTHEFYFVAVHNGQVYGVKALPTETEPLVLHELNFEVELPGNLREKNIYLVHELWDNNGQ